MNPDTRRRLAAAAAFLMLATAASRVLGLVREQIMLYYLGLGPEMGAFTVAFKVPSLVRTLVADTALSAAFIPVFSRLLAGEEREEAWGVARTVLLLTTAVLGLISLLGMIFAPEVIKLAAPGYRDPETIGLAVDLTRIMFPTVVILGLAGIFMGILNAYDNFSLPALAPIVWNLVIIAAVAAFTEEHGFYALAWGVTLGTVAELALQVPAVWRRRVGSGFVPLGHPAVRQIGGLLGPVVLSLGIVNFNALISTMVASYISEPAPAVIDKAFRLFQLPQGMFAVAIGTVLFPTLSRLAGTGMLERFRTALSTGLRQIFFVTLPFTGFFVVLGIPTVRLIFEHGMVTADDTEQVAWALTFYSLGMAFVSANTLLNRAFYGIQRPWLPLFVGLGNLALNTVLCILLYKPLGVGGITFATSVVSAFNCVALMLLLRRETGGVDGGAVVRSAARSFAAVLPLCAAAYGTWWLLDRWLGRALWAELVSVGGAYVVGLAVYALAARLMGMPELEEVLAVVRRRRDARATEEALMQHDDGDLLP